MHGERADSSMQLSPHITLKHSDTECAFEHHGRGLRLLQLQAKENRQKSTMNVCGIPQTQRSMFEHRLMPLQFSGAFSMRGRGIRLRYKQSPCLGQLNLARAPIEEIDLRFSLDSTARKPGL